MSLFTELLAQIRDSVQFLPDMPEEDADTTLRALWFAAAGQPRSAALASRGTLPVLDAPREAALRALVGRRAAGAPLGHLTGRQRFLDLEMFAGPGALIPRRETELLGRLALDLLREAAAGAGRAVVVDVCTGSGNLALALAAHVPTARVGAADLSGDAIAVARENARVMGLEGRVDFRTGDLCEPFGPDWDGTVDVLTCNPPYISTGRLKAMPETIAHHEPVAAFDGGPFGVRILHRVVREGLRLVRPGGWVCLEVGLGQGAPMAGLIGKHGSYGAMRTAADGRGEIRAIAAQVKS